MTTTTELPTLLRDWVLYESEADGSRELEVKVSISPGLTHVELWEVNADGPILGSDAAAARSLATLLTHVASIAETITAAVDR